MDKFLSCFPGPFYLAVFCLCSQLTLSQLPQYFPAQLKTPPLYSISAIHEKSIIKNRLWISWLLLLFYVFLWSMLMLSRMSGRWRSHMHHLQTDPTSVDVLKPQSCTTFEEILILSIFTRNAPISVSVLVKNWLPANSLLVCKYKKAGGLLLLLKMGGWQVTAHGETPHGTRVVPPFHRLVAPHPGTRPFLSLFFLSYKLRLVSTREKQALV